MVRYIGLDVHKRSLQAAFVDELAQVIKEVRIEEVSRDSLLRFALRHLESTDQVALEVTTNCWAVTRALRPHVAKVVVSNPMQTKAIASAKVKTDKVDAVVLAQLLRLDYLPTVWEPDEQTQNLRRWTERRGALVHEGIRLTNRIHAVLAERLLVCPYDPLSAAGRGWLSQLELDREGRWLIESDLRLAGTLQAELAGVDDILLSLAAADKRTRLLVTLPGFGIQVALALLAAWGDACRFSTDKKAAGYLGLAPSTRQSGDRCYHGPITKRGRTHARWMLIQAAQHVGRHPGPLGHFFRRLAKRKGHNVAVVATARKLAAIAWRVLTTGEPYRYALPGATEDKLRKLRIAATGERRKGGSPKGSKPVARLGAAVPSRRCRSLDEVYQSEGIASRQPAPAGEQKTIERTQSADFVAELARPKVIARRPCKARPASVGSSADASEQQGGPPAVRQAAQRGKG